MAGGMSRGPGRPTLAERSAAMGHGTVNRPPTVQPGPGRDYGESAAYRDLADGPCHVWVTNESGRNPGLLTEWRKHEQLPWEGHVVAPRLVGGRWVLVNQWFLASAIEPVGGDT